MPLLNFLGNIVADNTKTRFCRLAKKTVLASKKSQDYSRILFTEKRLNTAQTAQKINQRATYAANIIQQQTTAGVSSGAYVKQKIVLDQARNNNSTTILDKEDNNDDDSKTYTLNPEHPQDIDVWVDAADLYRHPNYYQDVIEQSLVNLISNKQASKYNYLHDKTAMRTFRAMLKDIATKKISEPMRGCTSIVNLIKKLPIHELYQEQLSHIFTKKDSLNTDLLTTTNFAIKAKEIFSTSNKQNRHSSEFTQLNKMLMNIIRNLDKPENFKSLLRLCASPAFQYAVLHQPSLGIAVQQLCKHDAGCQKNFQEFRVRSSANIRQYKKGIKSIDADMNNLISGYMFLQSTEDIDKTLENGAYKHYKHMHLNVVKRKITQGLAPAVCLGMFAVSIALLVPATALKVALGFSLTLGALGASILSYIHVKQYWRKYPKEAKDNTENKNNFSEKMHRFTVRSSITATDGVIGITAALASSMAALGAKVGLVALTSNPIAAGIVGGTAAATAIAVPLLGYAITSKELQQDIQDW
jgi:hypothetical protein